MVGVIQWRGSTPPDDAVLNGTKVVTVAVCPIEVFSETASLILGNRPVTLAEGLGSPWAEFAVGAKTSVWGARTVARKVQELLGDAP